MKIHVMENASQIGKAVGSLFVDAINEKPDITLGLATGASPIPAYKYIYKALTSTSTSACRRTTRTAITALCTVSFSTAPTSRKRTCIS